MDNTKKIQIRTIVRETMSNKVNSLIVNDIFMDNKVRDNVFNNLPNDIQNDEEVNDCMLNGDDGSVEDNIVEKFIDTLTDAFMNRFNYRNQNQ